MAYLDPYSTPLNDKAAAHLLRRATFGPARSEVAAFVGLSAADAVGRLITNSSAALAPSPPRDLDSASPTFGQQFLDLPYNKTKVEIYGRYVNYWWIGLMTQQNNKPSILEKLAAFWQNHFVVSSSVVLDYRMMYRYLQLIRTHSVGSFRTLAIEMTTDPAMLIFQNGNENMKGKPNENYARELQELFVVGEKDFYGNKNYTEDDVKAAARALTGWKVLNHRAANSTSFGSTFAPERHDETNKVFSSYYGNKVITGRTGAEAGPAELLDLINMLLAHKESPKYICRELYRWFVNTDVTQDIEDNVIVPLAAFFASVENDFNIEPVVRRLLSSDIFFSEINRGAIIKSPAEWTIGLLRFFQQPVPDMTTEYDAFKNYGRYIFEELNSLQYVILDQPTVFGYAPFYLTGYSDNWINGATLGARNLISNKLIYPYVNIKPGYVIGIDFVGWITSLQPNFSDVAGTPAITCEQIYEEFVKYLFATDLNEAQKNFLIDTAMMKGLARSNWTREWNNYRTTPGKPEYRQVILYRGQQLMRQMLRMAEYQMC
ncbi:MAG: DUF1800 domain-containing protein [Dyadobacter fermentans]